MGKPIYIVIDSESEFKIISKLIENSKYQFSSPNGTIDRYFVKNDLITLSNRLDPGRLIVENLLSKNFQSYLIKSQDVHSYIISVNAILHLDQLTLV